MVRTMNKRLGKEERSMKMVIGEAWEQRDGKKRGVEGPTMVVGQFGSPHVLKLNFKLYFNEIGTLNKYMER